MSRLRRRLTLSHDDVKFLDRWGLAHDRVGGFYIHHIAGPDPGLDLHDHPWTFVSIVLSGGYWERQADAFSDVIGPQRLASWPRWSIHRMTLHLAHRITNAAPGTWTLVLRGPTRRVWGFYPPEGRVEWTDYDYATRRPNGVISNRPEAAGTWSRWITDGLVIESSRPLTVGEMSGIKRHHQTTGKTAGTSFDDVQWTVRPAL